MKPVFKRVIVKFGSGILTEPGTGSPEISQFERFAKEISALVEAGHRIAMVSSGAVAAGMQVLGLNVRPVDLVARQACAAVGQSRLMHLYDTAFEAQGLHVAQLLLTHGDLDSRTRHSNARNTLDCLLQRGTIVPIINENDSVATEELKFGDNDRLSAEVAVLARADLLVLLTSVDGLMDPDGKLLDTVEKVDEVAAFARSDKGDFSVGGMVSKLQAVKMAVEAGIETVIASGRRPGLIAQILRGQPSGTRFLATQKATSQSQSTEKLWT